MAAATSSTAKDINAQRIARVLIDGELFDRRRLESPSQDAPFQHAMDRARQKYGHALCECRRPPLKLQIRLREDRYHLAVWPEEGHLHATNCIYFRDDEIAPAHIVPGAGDGPVAQQRHQVTFAHALERAATQPRPALRAVAGAESGKNPLSPEELSNLLWQKASLCDWHPSWSRDWGRTRYQLLRAASDIEIEGQALGERIFVPRPFRENQRDELNREWDSFVANLSRSSGSVVRSAFIVAPIRRITELPTGGMSLRLRHLRAPIGMTDGVYEHLMRSCRSALRRIDANDEAREQVQERPEGWVQLSQPEVVGVLLVEPSSRQGLWCRAAWMLQVHPRFFIPANNHDEVILIDELVTGNYQFTRHLSAQRPSDRDWQEWTVRHALDPAGRPVPRVALEIMSHGAGADYRQRRAALVDALAARGIPTWTWIPVGAQMSHRVPPLPPHEGTPPGDIAHALAALVAARDLYYAYGSGRSSQNN